ncbi:hypothetical protein ACA910_005529 [Epithemia clementina (nom. ined.)]
MFVFVFWRSNWYGRKFGASIATRNDAQVVDIEDLDLSNLNKQSPSIWLMSTYGEGEPTDNSASFIAHLK